MSSIITDTSIKLLLNSTENLELLNKVNTNTQLFVNYIELDEKLTPYITSNVLSQYTPTTNLTNLLSQKQNTLNSSSVLFGDGSSITNINYGTITGKPTNFQSDFLSTVINKPSTYPADMTYIYTKTQNDTLLNTKQATLTASTNILGIGSSITALNYNNISNPPNLSQYALSTDLATKQNTLSASTTLLGIGSGITALNYNNISNPPNLSQYALTTSLSTKQDTLTASTTLLGIGSGITALNYGNISNPPTLNFLPLTGGTITGNIIINITNSAFYFGSGGGASIGQASGVGAFSSSAVIDDCIVRSKTSSSLILQSGSGAGAIIISSANNVSITNTLNATTLQQGGVGVSTLITNALSSSYLPLTGGTLTGQLILSTASGNNPLYITSTSTTANNCIQIKNNSTFNVYIGVGGTALGGNYANNFFIESASSSIVLNTNGRGSASTPNMIVHSTGNVGIGTTNPQYLLDVNGTLNTTGAITANGNSLVFPNTLRDFKISLWGPNIYGFGVQVNELKYISGLNHKFYNSTTNTFTIDGSGNTSCSGSITAGTNIVSTSGISTFKSIYITNPNNSITHLPYTNGENYIRGKVNIDQNDLYVGGTTTLNSSLSVGGSLSGAPNVSKRALFSFTPISTLMSRYYYVIDLTQYISFLSAPICNHYIFRIHIWSQSGDFGDTFDVVENMTYLIYLSTFGSGKSRFYQIVNSSTSSTLSFINGSSIYYSGSPNSAGASIKYCSIENISGY